jgi:hypothetical protein
MEVPLFAAASMNWLRDELRAPNLTRRAFQGTLQGE